MIEKGGIDQQNVDDKPQNIVIRHQRSYRNRLKDDEHPANNFVI